jgi:hypothetical protein
MDDLNRSEVEIQCKELLSAFQGTLSWKWDSRFETVLAEFGADLRENIRAILNRCLTLAWDASNIGGAPAIVQAINRHLGGLRPGQLLFTSDPNRDAFIYCAWWPWGNGKTISIRIAPSYKKSLDSQKAEGIQHLKGWFGI